MRTARRSPTLAALLRIALVLALFGVVGCGKSQEELDRELSRQALAGNAQEARKLLKQGAAPNHADGNGITPLMKAADSGDLETVRALLEAGADLSMKDRAGDTALLHAVTEPAPDTADADRLAVVRDLLKAGAFIEEKGKREETPLIRAAAWGSADTVRILVQTGADLEAKNALGMTALMCAANQPASVRDTTEAVKILLEAGARPNEKSKEGKTALQYSERHGSNPDITELLQQEEAQEESESAEEGSTGGSPLDALLSVPGKILRDFQGSLEPPIVPEEELERLQVSCRLHKPARGQVSCSAQNGSSYAIEQYSVEFRGTTRDGGQHLQEFVFTPRKPLQPGESGTESQDCGFTFDFDVTSFRLTGALGKKSETPAGEKT